MKTGQEQRRSRGNAETSDTRVRLLDATINVLDEAGTEAATSRAIAESAGENLGSITYYFGSKDQLVQEAMMTTARRLIQPVVDEFTGDDRDSITKLLGAVQQLYKILNENEKLLGPYVQLLAAATTNTAVATEVKSLHTKLSEVLIGEIVAQQQQELLPAWVDAEAMAQLIVSLVNGVAISTAINGEDSQAIAVGAQFTQLLLSVRATDPPDREKDSDF